MKVANTLKRAAAAVVLAGGLAATVVAAGHGGAASSRPAPPAPWLPGRIAAAGDRLAAPLEAAHARAVLARLAARHQGIGGVSVELGPTPSAAQAVAYYRDGRIVISDERTASVEEILAHELWHIVDWRDNGTLDWGERVPPGATAPAIS